MLYPVQVEQQNGYFQASVLTLPTLTKIAPSRIEVLRLIQDALVEYSKRVEIIYMEIPETSPSAVTEEHWVATAGMFAHDPTLLPMLDKI